MSALTLGFKVTRRFKFRGPKLQGSHAEAEDFLVATRSSCAPQDAPLRPFPRPKCEMEGSPFLEVPLSPPLSLLSAPPRSKCGGFYFAVRTAAALAASVRCFLSSPMAPPSAQTRESGVPCFSC
jgi:hypothetical protein